MIVKSSEIKPVPVEIVQDVICNNCGESCMKNLGETGMRDNYGITVSIAGGYYSECLPDGVGYEFELCEKCVAAIIKGLKIPPVMSSEFP